MIGKKTAKEVQRDVVANLEKLPGRCPDQWLDREIQTAKHAPDRDLETLEFLKSALENAVKKKRSKAKTATSR